jgi:hypothetical protein
MQHMVENLLKKTTLKDLLRSESEMREWLKSFDGAGVNAEEAQSLVRTA